MALLLTRRYLLALPLATAVAALAVGIPTDVQPLLGAAALLLTLVVFRRRVSQLSGACASRSAVAGPATRQRDAASIVAGAPAAGKHAARVCRRPGGGSRRR